MAHSNTDSLKVLSLNCWGLKYVSKLRKERLRSIGTYLSNLSGLDIVGLQEVWVLDDYQVIRRQVEKNLPYSKYFHSGVFGGGLAIFSKYPIINTNFFPYTLNGKPLYVWHGDWFVGKGLASVVIRHPTLEQVEIFNTHYIAEYGTGPDIYLSHRVSQAWEHANALLASVERGHHVISLGDFNSNPGSLVHEIITKHAQMLDVWAISPKDGNNEIPPSPNGNSSTNLFGDAERSLSITGITCDSPLNTWTTSKSSSIELAPNPGNRLDYIFFCNAKTTIPKPKLQVKSCKIVFTELVPGLNVSYSDHFGIFAVFNILSHDDVSMPTIQEDTLSQESLDAILTLYNSGHQTSQRSSWVLGMFVSLPLVCLLVPLLAVAAALTPGPQPINVIYVVISALTGFLAWTFFLISFLGGRAERNGLVQAHDSVETWKHAMQ